MSSVPRHIYPPRNWNNLLVFIWYVAAHPGLTLVSSTLLTIVATFAIFSDSSWWSSWLFWLLLATLLGNCLLGVFYVGQLLISRSTAYPYLGLTSYQSEPSLDAVQPQFLEQGWSFVSVTDGQAIVRKNSWGWWGLAGLYVGLSALCLLIWASHYTHQVEQTVLLPNVETAHQLLNGQLILDHAEAELSNPASSAEGVSLTYIPQSDPDQHSHFWWQSYTPVFLQSNWLLISEVKPLLTVQATGPQNRPLRLVAVQDNIAPSELIHLSFETDAPLYVIIPAADLTFELTPLAEFGRYTVQLLRPGETIPSERFELSEPQFTVDEVTVILNTSEQVTLVSYRNLLAWGYPVVSGGLVLCSLLFFWRKPKLLWLIEQPEQRIGGR